MPSARDPVASTEYRDRHGLERPEDLQGAVSIQDETADMWGGWCDCSTP